MIKQTEADEIADKGIKEKEFEHITRRLDKVERAVIET